MVERKYDRIQRFLTLRRFQLTLPYRDTMPPHFSQLALLLLITLLIPTNLRHPELPIRIRNLAARTIHYSFFTIHFWQRHIVSMPKAPIHEDACPILPQHQVRMPRQFRRVQPIAESPLPQPLAHNHLRLRIPIISGFVSFPRIAAMLLCRCSAESLSISLQRFKQCKDTSSQQPYPQAANPRYPSLLASANAQLRVHSGATLPSAASKDSNA